MNNYKNKEEIQNSENTENKNANVETALKNLGHGIGDDTVSKRNLKNSRKDKLKIAKEVSSKGSEMHRVVISKEANEALEKALSRCCDGFESGNITKSDVANYIFKQLDRFLSEGDVKNIRKMHFDEKKVLSSILKSDSDLPEDLKSAIRAHYGLSQDKNKKKSVRQVDFSTD